METVDTKHIADPPIAPGSSAAANSEPAATHHHNDHAPSPPSRSLGAAGKLFLGLCLLGGMLTLGILPRLQQSKKLEAMADTQIHAVPLVQVVCPHTAPSRTDLVLPGNVQAFDETIINARTNGYLQRRYVDIGDHVRQGQVLAEIAAPELDQQWMQARAEASKSQAVSEQAQADEVRLGANVAQARAELVRTQSSLGAARADLAHARAKLLEAQGAKSEAMAKLDQAGRKLKGQKAELVRAHAHAALAEKTWKRWQELAAGGAVSGQELDETQADFESNQAAVTAAQADVESAQADVDAAQQAVRSREGDVTAAQADVTAAVQNVSAAAAAVTSAQANVQAAQANKQASQANVRATQAGIQASQANVNSYSTLRGFERIVAPFNGVITARNVDTGALISAGSGPNTGVDPTSTVPHSGLFGIARTDVLRIQVQIPESFVSNIRRGQPAYITVQELPGRTFEGSVYDTAGALDATSRTLLTEVRVKNPDSLLMPGMYAQVRFVVPQSHPTLRIPANTLIIDSDGTRVAAVTADHKIHFQTVKISRDYGKEVEITEGLTGRESLVTNPTDELTEGMPVNPTTGAK